MAKENEKETSIDQYHRRLFSLVGVWWQVILVELSQYGLDGNMEVKERVRERQRQRQRQRQKSRFRLG